MKNANKYIALFLLITMAAAVFAGCNSNPNPGGGTTAASQSSSQTGEDEARPDIPDDLRFDGASFLIYNGTNVNTMDDFNAGDDQGDVVSAARFRWMSAAEERFGISIDEELVFKSFEFIGGGIGHQLLLKLYTAGDTTYDAVEICVYDMSSAAPNGVLANMANYPYIDLTQSWWDNRVNEDLSFYGCVYFTTGEISLSDNSATHCIVFNKPMAERLSIDPYESVRQNNWTIETFINQVKMVSEDLDGDGKVSGGADRYGLVTWDDSAYGILASIGEATVLPNENGDLTLTFFSEKTENAFEQYRSIYFSEYVYNFYRVSTNPQNAITPFGNDQMLYYMTKFNAVAQMRDTEIDYGIVPFPKYDSQQENYGHVVAAFDVGFIGIPMIVADQELSGSVLEYLAWSGQKIMTPAYYEKTLIGTYIRDDESSGMLDIIFSSHIYDVGLYLNVGGIRDILKSLANDKNFVSISTIKAAREKKYNSELEKLNESFAKLAEELK